MIPARQRERASTPLEELLHLLQLECQEPGRLRGWSTSRSLPFVFGGQVAAQALAAGYSTVRTDRRVNSLHSYFLAPGNPERALEFGVEKVREGRSFSVRRVMVTQGGPPIFSAMMSFHVDEPGTRHTGRGMPTVPTPDSLSPLDDWLRPHAQLLPDWWKGPMAIDLRYVEEPPHVRTLPRSPQAHQRIWMRPDGSLPPTPWIHDCVFTFASDLTLLDPVLLANGLSWYTGRVWAASLDHAIWFHRPMVMDDWLLYDQESPASSGGTALSVGHVFSRDGQLLASVSQQGIVRVQD